MLLFFSFFFVFLILFISPSGSVSTGKTSRRNRDISNTSGECFRGFEVAFLSSSSYLKARWKLRFKGLEKNSKNRHETYFSTASSK